MADTYTGPIYEVGAQFVEQLNYSNPLHRPVRSVWYNNERFFIINTNYEVFWTDAPEVLPIEYLFYFGDPSDPDDATPVPGQYPVYSLVPGFYHYQPVVEVANVYVPRAYQVNAIRNSSAILGSNYPIEKTGRYFVRPVL